MKKHISVMLVLLLIFISISVPVAATDNCIENGNFESDTLLWSHGSFSEEGPRFGMRCLSFTAPSYSADGNLLHLNTYLSTVSLTENTVYSLKFYIRTDKTDTPQLLPECAMHLSGDSGSLSVNVSHVTNTWQPVTVCFTADTTGTFSFFLKVENSYEDATIFIDEIRLSAIDFTPVHLDIQGRRNLTIPDVGEISSKYIPVVTDGNGNYVSNQNATLEVVGILPEGVRFDDTRGTLYVDENAPIDGTISLLCKPSAENTSFLPVTVAVHLSYNLMTNSSFEDIPFGNGWNRDEYEFNLSSDMEGNLFAEVSALTESNGVYSGRISPSPAFLLDETQLYVFRAMVRSHSAESIGPAQATSTVSDSENTIYVKIENISNTWTEVFTAVRVSSYGFYTLELECNTAESQHIYIDDVRLQPESPAPSGIVFDTPVHISIPKEDRVDCPIPYVVYDQEKNHLQDEVHFSIFPENEGVMVSGGKISVLSSAQSNTYAITASLIENPDVQYTKMIQIDSDSVGDGSFEKTLPGEWWATSSPSLLYYSSTYEGTVPTNGSNMARLTMNGAVSALLSNSISRYNAGESYVFEADMQTIVPDIETVVTVLVYNAHSSSFDDSLVVGQFSISDSMDHIQKLFTPSESVTGRLMIAFNTPENHSQQIILLDAVSVSPAAVYASSVSIGGMPYVDRNIVGKYRFSSNFSAVDSSSFRWLFSSTADGVFMPMDGQTGTTLSITSDLEGKYVKFEVTPISLSGPVVGESSVSAAIRIGEPIPAVSSRPSSSPGEPTEEDKKETDPVLPPEESANASPLGMNILNIHKFSVPLVYTFFDITQHWAKNDIELLNAAGVVQGRGNGLFEPESYITRAEFSAILARAFELAPIYYEGQFSDVKKHNWYAGVVAVVTKHGIAHGTSETTFSPELPITREEMAAMIMRAYRKTGAQTNGIGSGYADAAEISAWALSDVREANALGLLYGLPDGSFQPKRNATRAEATVIIKRMLMKLSENY